MTTDLTPTTLATTAREQGLNDVFTTALEGGIGYWSVCSVYRWSVEVEGRREQARDFVAVIHDSDDQDGTEWVIDRTVIARGIKAAYARGNWNKYQGRALRDLNFGKWDDVDFDAITADLIVQFGLFGEEVYG